MAGTLVTERMNNWNLQSGSGVNFTGASGAVNIGALQNFNNMMGGLASTGVTYGLTGNAKVNLINTSMFGLTDVESNAVSVGLFEFGFGDDGIQTGIGMNGTDLNVMSLYQSVQGFEDMLRISQLKLGGKEGKTTIECIAMYDNTKNSEAHELARRLFGGETDIEFESGEDVVNGERREYLGKYDHDDPDTIVISEQMLGAMTQEEYAKIASVVRHEGSHEGSHMLGEHVEANAYVQSFDTYGQIVTNLGLEGDAAFAMGMLAGMMKPENQVPNTGSVEYFDINFTDKEINFELADQKDIYLTTIIAEKYKEFTFIAKQSNKEMSLIIGSKEDFLRFFEDQLTQGVKLGLADYSSGEIQTGEDTTMNFLDLFIGIDTTENNCFIGANLEILGMSQETLLGDLEANSVTGQVFAGVYDGSFSLSAFIATGSATISNRWDIPFTNNYIDLYASLYAPGTIGAQISVGAQSALHFGNGTFGLGFGTGFGSY